MYRKNSKKQGANRGLISFKYDKSSDFKELNKQYAKVKNKYGVSSAELISRLEEKEVLIPSCVFNKKLSTFESIVKYLKENLGAANKEIAEFCTTKYGVTFQMMEKFSIKGENPHPIYKWLTNSEENGTLDAKVSWNF